MRCLVGARTAKMASKPWLAARTDRNFAFVAPTTKLEASARNGRLTNCVHRRPERVAGRAACAVSARLNATIEHDQPAVANRVYLPR